MSILSGLFSSDSSEDSSSDLFSMLDAALSIDASNESYEQTVDDDGSSHTSYDSSHFGTDLDTSGVLTNMFDGMSDSDSGGIFG